MSSKWAELTDRIRVFDANSDREGMTFRVRAELDRWLLDAEALIAEEKARDAGGPRVQQEEQRCDG